MPTPGWGKRGPCPSCGASRANIQHSDGYSKCFKCKKKVYHTTGKVQKDVATEQAKIVPMERPLSKDTSTKIVAIPDRKISLDTAKFYGVASKLNGSVISHHTYPYHDSQGNHVCNKMREIQSKKFWSEGKMETSVLFGQNKFTSGGKYITVCEGEVDAMSAYQMFGSKWPAVSLKNGAASAVNNCKQSFEYLNTFDTVVLCFDSDQPGKEAALEVARLFEPNKCRICNLSLKDANEFLKMGQTEKFIKEWWASET